MRRIIDISVPLSGHTPLWPGSTGVRLTRVRDQSAGDSVTASKLETDVHAATHVDAPLHFLPGGASVDALPLDVFLGPAEVVDVGACRSITGEVLGRLVPKGADRVLLRTVNAERWRAGSRAFDPDFAGLTADGARWLVEGGVRLVGNDYLSIQRLGETDDVHRVLLGAGVAVVEGLDLSDVAPGRYELICLPLKLEGAEAAPARAVLIEEGRP